MRLFIALALPEIVRKTLRQALMRYESFIGHVVAEERWHLTLCFLGESTADQDISVLLGDVALPFLPAVAVTHVGRGEQPHQLWAYAAPTYPLQALQKLITERVRSSGLVLPQADFTRDFIPHIHVADIAEAVPSMLPDETIQKTFVPPEAILYASLRDGEAIYYEQQGAIQLKA